MISYGADTGASAAPAGQPLQQLLRPSDPGQVQTAAYGLITSGPYAAYTTFDANGQGHASI